MSRFKTKTQHDSKTGRVMNVVFDSYQRKTDYIVLVPEVHMCAYPVRAKSAAQAKKAVEAAIKDGTLSRWERAGRYGWEFGKVVGAVEEPDIIDIEEIMSELDKEGLAV